MSYYSIKTISLKIYGVLIILYGLQNYSYAQKDSIGIKPFSQKITIIPFYNKSGMFLRISKKNNSTAFEPNSQNTIGLELRYKSLGLSLAFGILDEENDVFKAKLVNYDFRFNFFYRRLLISSSFQFYKGFSVDKNDVAIEDVEQVVPDLRMFNLAINTLYAFNKNYSFNAVFKNTERLLYSRGSFIGGFSQIYTQLKAKSSIYPDDVDTEEYDSDGIGRFYSAFLTGGYQYAFIYKKWYIAPLFVAGFGFQYQYYINENQENKASVNPAYKYIFNLPFGFNGDKVFFGINYSVDNSQMLFEASKMRLKSSSIIAFIGLRFY